MRTMLRGITIVLALLAVAALSPVAALAAPTATQLVTGLEGGAGSTVGPGKDLYVTERKAGRISRVDPKTGEVTTFASGLPLGVLDDFGGVMDVAFIGHTAYALVSVVFSDTVGIYRIDGPNSYTVIADIGAWATSHPPSTPFDLAIGVQYALEPDRGGFLVTDGHHNRVLRVTLDGQISQVVQFGDIVPTGLAMSGQTVYMAEAGPVPHHPADGKVVAFDSKKHSKTPRATEVASGAPLLVDVEFGHGHRLYALSQGMFGGGDPGSPATPDTGSLVMVNGNGSFTRIVGGLDRPTSLEFVGKTAYVITLTGEIWRLDDTSKPPTDCPGGKKSPGC